MTGLGKQSSLHLNLFGNDGEEELHVDCSVLKKVHQTYWKRNQDAVNWNLIFQSEGSRIAILAYKITCNHYPRHSARRLH